MTANDSVECTCRPGLAVPSICRTLAGNAAVLYGSPPEPDGALAAVKTCVGTDVKAIVTPRPCIFISLVTPYKINRVVSE